MYEGNAKVRAQNFKNISCLHDDGTFVGVLKCTSDPALQKLFEIYFTTAILSLESYIPDIFGVSGCHQKNGSSDNSRLGWFKRGQ